MKEKEYALTIRLPSSIYAEIEKIARENYTSKSDAARQALIKGIVEIDKSGIVYASRADWSKAVKQRDNYACIKCGSDTALEAHHVTPVAKGGLNTVSNGKTLCRKCHEKEHADKVCDGRQKRRMIAVRLPEWLLKKLKDHPQPASSLIESALIEAYNLSPPE